MSRRRKLVSGVLINAAAFTSIATAGVVHENVARLARAAQQIVLGDVVSVTSFWDDEHALIKSRIVVNATQYLVGSGGGTEVLQMSGGTVDDVTLRVSVLPVFEPGDHVLLFLNDNEIRLVDSFQGAYLTDGVQVVRMGPACVRAIPDTLEPLSVLLEEIQRALPPGTTLPEIIPYTRHFQLPAAERYSLCGASWAYQANPMGEDYVINANCVDASAGDAASQRTQIQNGAAAWNNAGAAFVFTYGGPSTQANVVFNGTNLIYFDTTPPDGGSYVAATYYWSSGNDITECDLVFNDRDYMWWNGSGSCGGSKMDIWDVATHELGHFLCLADLYGGGDAAKTMYGYVDYCETQKQTLEPDDINGIIAIYGASALPCPECPDYDWDLAAPTTGWQTDSWSVEENGCKAYRIWLQPDTEYTFKTGCGDGATATFDTVLEVRDASCVLVASDNDGCEANRSKVQWTTDVGGDYFVKVQGYAGAGGNYTLAYRQEPTPCTECPGYDQTLNEPALNWQTDSSDVPVGGCRVFRVQLQSAQAYTFKTGCADGATAEFDTVLELSSSGCSLLGSDDNGCEEYRSKLTWTAAYSGYHYLKVRGYDNSEAGSYTLAYRQECETHTWCRDADGDGDGNPNNTQQACDQPFGYVLNCDDCDDDCPSCYPGATEICDGRDNDCDGQTDEEDASGCTTYYRDDDNDGYGLSSDYKCLCSASGEYRANQGSDCDDECPSCYPGATETCDGRDNDCDGQTDEEDASGCTTYYRDDDNDGYGLSSDYKCLCTASGEYRATQGSDCDDDCPSCFPGATEVCDGRDNNCDSQIDEGGVCPGACCFSDGTCDELRAAECAAGGGTYRGANTDCTPNPCEQPPQTGGCCLSNGGCDELTSAECATAGGTYRGANTDCTPDLCGHPLQTGGCCLSDGGCDELTSAECATAGGTYRGDSTDCTPDPCGHPPETGACCLPAGICVETTESACEDAEGGFLGIGSTCDGNSCRVLPCGDSDGDDVCDGDDHCPNTPAGGQVDADGCLCSQLDDDGDGVNNCDDACPDTSGSCPNGCSPSRTGLCPGTACGLIGLSLAGMLVSHRRRR